MADSEPQTLITRTGEYVLGTLDTDERARFEQELTKDAAARRELSYWEGRLGAIGLAAEPVEPPSHVWTRIEERLAEARMVPIAPSTSAPPPAMHAADGGGGAWRGLAIAASLAALVMAALLFMGSSRDDNIGETAPAYASMVYDAPTGTSWLVTASTDTEQLSITALSSYDVPAGKVLRAWLVPADGKPVALGEWPHTRGAHKMPVSGAAAEYMKKRASLMVSMEDAGSSMSDTPRGRLMWTSPLAARTG